MDFEPELRRKYNVKAAADVGRGEIRKPPPLFTDLLLQRSLIMVSAEPFTGKSMLSIAMLLALDANRPLLQQFAPYQPLRSLYVGQDSPEWDYAEQFRKLTIGYQLTEQEVANLSSDMVFNGGLDLASATSREFLKAWHEDVGFDVLFLDTFASTNTLDENSNTEMGLLMKVLKGWRDTFGCTIIFTHHDSKPSKEGERSAVYRPRGASIISGSVDIHVALRPHNDGSISLTMPKGRGIANHRRALVYDMVDCGTPDNAGVRLECRQTNTAAVSAVDAMLTDTPVERKVLIAKYLERFPTTPISSVGSTVDNILNALLRTGKAQKAGRGQWKRHSKSL